VFFNRQCPQVHVAFHKMTDIKVLIASSSPAARAEIEEQLLTCDTIRVVGSAGANVDVLKLTARFKPDVLVFHAASCGKPQMDMLFHLRQIHSSLKTLALECSPEHVRAYFINLASWGLRGCICEWRNSAELIDAVCTLGRGDFYLCPMASHALVDAYRDMIHQVVQEEI
jgi:DNA-binding NarL/FixJ family response regulator